MPLVRFNIMDIPHPQYLCYPPPLRQFFCPRNLLGSGLCRISIILTDADWDRRLGPAEPESEPDPCPYKAKLYVCPEKYHYTVQKSEIWVCHLWRRYKTM